MAGKTERSSSSCRGGSIGQLRVVTILESIMPPTIAAKPTCLGLASLGAVWEPSCNYGNEAFNARTRHLGSLLGER